MKSCCRGVVWVAWLGVEDLGEGRRQLHRGSICRGGGLIPVAMHIVFMYVYIYIYIFCFISSNLRMQASRKREPQTIGDDSYGTLDCRRC